MIVVEVLGGWGLSGVGRGGCAHLGWWSRCGNNELKDISGGVVKSCPVPVPVPVASRRHVSLQCCSSRFADVMRQYGRRSAMTSPVTRDDHRVCVRVCVWGCASVCGPKRSICSFHVLELWLWLDGPTGALCEPRDLYTSARFRWSFRRVAPYRAASTIKRLRKYFFNIHIVKFILYAVDSFDEIRQIHFVCNITGRYLVSTGTFVHIDLFFRISDIHYDSFVLSHFYRVTSIREVYCAKLQGWMLRNCSFIS